jgi:hypothetical protein
MGKSKEVARLRSGERFEAPTRTEIKIRGKYSVSRLVLARQCFVKMQGSHQYELQATSVLADTCALGSFLAILIRC